MIVDVVVPKQGMAMASAVLVLWHAEVGDIVTKGEAIAEIETDKVHIDVESPVTGILIERLVEEDAEFPVPSAIGRIDSGKDSM